MLGDEDTLGAEKLRYQFDLKAPVKVLVLTTPFEPLSILQYQQQKHGAEWALSANKAPRCKQTKIMMAMQHIRGNHQTNNKGRREEGVSYLG